MHSRIDRAPGNVNSENIIVGKKIGDALPQVPRRRPALGDLSNKIGNQVSQQINLDKCKISDKPPTQTSSIVPNMRPMKILTREESKLDVTTFSNKQLLIYDPDVSTKNDPNAVTEYLEDIYSHLREIERQYAIKENYLLDHQTTIPMREILINWIVELQISFKFCVETFHLSISIIDRYLQGNKNIGSSTLQLVGITAVMLACKYEEIFIPDISDFVYVCDDSFTKKQILTMERDIVRSLQFYLGRPTSIHFLRRFSKIARVSAQQHNLGKYLLELASVEYNVCHILPSYLAAAACCLSISILEDEMDLTKVWSPTLVHYTTYKLNQFRDVVVSLARILLKADTSRRQAVRQKYASSSYGKISTSHKLPGRIVKKLCLEKQTTKQ